jgi:hypothetical protein
MSDIIYINDASTTFSASSCSNAEYSTTDHRSVVGDDVVGFGEAREAIVVEASEVIEDQIFIYPLPVKDYVQEKFICSQRMCYVLMFSSILFLVIIVIIFANNPNLKI